METDSDLLCEEIMDFIIAMSYTQGVHVIS